MLIVDDETTVLKNFARVLERNGYEVDSAKTGQEALEKLETKNYDVTLFERQLPDMDGKLLLVKMRSLFPTMVKVILTGWSLNEDDDSLIAMGLDAYLKKPIAIQHLLQIINGAFEDKTNEILPIQ
jgi:DNA-binding response OmpR family regulator